MLETTETTMPEENAEFYCLCKDCGFLQAEAEAAQADDKPVNTPLLVKHTDGDPPYQYVQLTETEGFILRLLLQQLNISLVRQGVKEKSSNPLTDQDADALIQSIIAHFVEAGFIQSMTQEEVNRLKLPLGTQKDRTMDTGSFTKLSLDASINQLGPIVIKITWPPK